ncbi:MAG: hypothetical protein BMS9Abin23_1135 [Thermodesulfobacteriota bacterium]|nr:MAG: hypothetical protein BMS9Abin23_1135 [Thermodesulfobacteriota bacterium]
MPDIIHHHIKIKEGPGGSPVEWEDLIKKVHGVTNVRVYPKKMDIYVEYDVLECCEEAIEKWMVKSGFVLDDSYLQRMKRGWIHYTDENELDAMKMKPHSHCNVDEEEEKKEKDME